MVNNPKKHQEQLSQVSQQRMMSQQTNSLKPPVQAIDIDDQSVVQGAIIRPAQKNGVSNGHAPPKPSAMNRRPDSFYNNS